MTSKKYIITAGLIFAFVSVAYTGVNVYLNDFGLWRSRDSIRIWGFERTSKYLLAKRYVPENFEGILIGSSVSDNLNTKLIDQRKFYNLSINGGNITELQLLVSNVLKNKNRKTNHLLICLYPYMTQNSGKKTSQMNSKETIGSIYSTLPLKVAAAKRKAKTRTKAKDRYADSDWGLVDFSREFDESHFENYFNKRGPTSYSTIKIDPLAYKQLQQVINDARAEGFTISAFYYPIYHVWNKNQKKVGSWQYYQAEMQKLFEPQDSIWDFNTSEYAYINSDSANYRDAHLGKRGAGLVAKALSKLMKTSRE